MPKHLLNMSNESLCLTASQISEAALRRLHAQRAFAAKNRAQFEGLSKREVEVLSLICAGHKNRWIAEKLHVSLHTIRTHRQNIRRQLGIHGVVEAVWWGQCFDLV